MSVVNPVYSESNFIWEAVGSALRQTDCKDEVIIVNDGSNNGEEREKFAQSYRSRIRYFGKENGEFSDYF